MKRPIMAFGVGLLLSACGGGSSSTGSGGTIQGLDIPANFSVLAAAGGGASGASAPANRRQALGVRAARAYDSPGTAYSTDEMHVYVHDDSMESLSTINSILCYLNQTAAAQMVNQGPYIALVNTDRCEQGSNQSNASQGGSSSGAATTFARWVVESARADNESPQIVHIWLPNPGEGTPDGSRVLVDLRVTEGVSDARPFGSFHMNFKGVLPGEGGTETAKMQGMLETVANAAGKPQFRFINLSGNALDPSLPGDHGGTESANVRLGDAAATRGLAITHRDQSGGGGPAEQATYAVAYNATNFLAALDTDGDDEADAQVCRSREQYDTRVWQYALYHGADTTFRGNAVTAGSRATLNSGFPFSYDGDGGSSEYGWLGYNGIWTESQQPLVDGQTIHRFNYSNDSSTDYSVRVSPGKLVRRSASQVAVGELVGEQFVYWGMHPGLGIHGQWTVTVDADLAFQLTSAVTFGDSGPVYSETVDSDGNPATPPVAVATTLNLGANETLWLYSDALGGNVVYRNDPAVAPELREVTFFAEEFVNPADATLFSSGDGPVTLYCYDRCLKGGLTQADVDAAAGNEQALYHPYQGQPFTYTLTAANGKVMLIDDANDGVVAGAGLALDSVNHSWGINTGEMLTTALADPAQPWLVVGEPVTYRWETGPNDRNRLVTAADGQGMVARFDRPLQFAYTHAAANDINGDNAFDGKPFLLNYGGAGSLGGIPSLSGQGSNRWIPAINLVDGVLLADAGSTFVVRGLEAEQSMRVVAGSECSGLDAGAAYTDPGLALPAPGDIGDVSFTLADQPVVTGPPAVIEGVVQGAAGSPGQ